MPDKLTPEEQEVLNYHRRNLQTGIYQKNADGSLTTFKGAVVGLPGGETIIPTYWYGQERDVPTAVRFMQRSGIKFPSYSSVDQALARERELHSMMEQDTSEFMKARK
ncbi:MAG: hypothetical protein ACOYBR_10300 [Fluviibacter sp.]